METKSTIPASVAEDSSDVVEALDVARALWEKGERKDAIRWVRRAAEAADDADQTMRVAELARAAAELDEVASVAPPPPQSQTRVTSPPRPLSATPPPPRVTQAPPPPRATTPPPPASTRAPKPGTPPRPHFTAKPEEPPREKRIRVCIRISVREPDLMVLRALPDGEAAPPGTREGWLVMPEGVEEAKGNVA